MEAPLSVLSIILELGLKSWIRGLGLLSRANLLCNHMLPEYFREKISHKPRFPPLESPLWTLLIGRPHLSTSSSEQERTVRDESMTRRMMTMSRLASNALSVPSVRLAEGAFIITVVMSS